MKHICAFLAIASLMSACLTDVGEELGDPKAVTAYSFKTAIVSGRDISFVVTCEVPTPCWAFNRIDSARSGNTFTVTVFARRTTSGPCLTVLSSIDAPFDVTVESAGSYTFEFWRYDGTVLDTTLVVP